MADVTYICKRTVVSTKPVRPGKQYSLSVLDRLMEHKHLRIVYYFRTPGKWEVGELTQKLRESISEMLNCYPIVTGRLIKDQDDHWMIKCNDAGVRMVEARAKGSVEEWLKSVDRDKELKLVHWEEMFHKPYFWSTFYVQLTEFEAGGLAIGLSCIHLLADLNCATVFIKAWADTTIAGKLMHPPLFYPLAARRNPENKASNNGMYKDLIDYYKFSIEQSNSVADNRYATISLAFSDSMVRACIAMAQSHTDSSPSPFEALSGLLWVCISKLKGRTDGLTDMSICLDTRKMLGLDPGFFGNCMVYNKVQAEEFTTEHDQLSAAAKAIGNAVSEIDNGRIIDLIEWLERNDFQSPPWMNCHDLICTSLEGGVDPYLSLFEDNSAPIRVSCYVEPLTGIGQVLIVPSPPGEGQLSRTVMVTLPEDEADKLCQHDLILRFSPTVLVGMNKTS